MNWIKTQWALLKKYGFVFPVCMQTGIAIYFFVRAFMGGGTYEGVCYVCFGVMLIMMDLLHIVTANLNSQRDIYRDKFDDAQDKLILARHEVERLRFELETAQSELAKQATHVQTGLVQIGQTDEACAESPGAKSKPKRPAFKRKPRPKQTENENKD